MHHHRDGIRPRPIDDHKPYFVIKDLTQAKLTSNKEGQTELCNIEKELYKVLEYYDKRKKIEIPKSKIINEKNDKNDKNENKNNNNINNNIIYINENNDNKDQNNNAYILNYKLSEYKRPEHYIIYSSKKKNEIDSTKKIYEANEEDKIFLDVRENFTKIEELENIMVDLENNATNEKDDKINEENAKKILEKNYGNYKNYFDAIITHFKGRRNGIKKSLIRKKWHINKSTDKYLNTTFRKRERDKIKTRKNNQNKDESLTKIIESETFCKNYLLQLLNDMANKEKSNKLLLQIEENIFLSEYDKIKKVEIPIERINENNLIKENIDKNVKILNKKHETIPNKDTNKTKNANANINGVINNINTSKNNNGNNSSNNNNNNLNSNEEFNSINKLSNDNRNLINNNGDSLNNSGMNNNGSKKIVERKPGYKNNIKNKNNEIFPALSLEPLLNSNNMNLNEEDENNYIKNKNNNLRVRIRINRNNKITIDRYIQNKNDFNPFHDCYNDVINEYKKYDNNAYNYLENKNFENLFNSYNLNKAKNLDILYDSDDDSIDVNNDLKHFSNSYKQFLKLKKSHS